MKTEYHSNKRLAFHYHYTDCPMTYRLIAIQISSLIMFLFSWKVVHAEAVPNVVASVKASVVAISTYDRLRSPATVMIATGFAIADGTLVATNAHVLAMTKAASEKTVLGIVNGTNLPNDFRPAEIVAIDQQNDLAVLKISGAPLVPLKLGDSDAILEGNELLFTGFPLGLALGFHHVTHRAMISSILPLTVPAKSASELTSRSITVLGGNSKSVFQLDATAYPGNSGSPLYSAKTGEVFGIVNRSLVRKTKDAAAVSPGGVAYAIPSRALSDLVKKHAGDDMREN